MAELFGSRIGAGTGTGVMTPPAQREPAGFAYQRCKWCASPSFRRLLCPVCASSDLETEHSAGLGIVVQSRVVHRGTGAARNESLVRFPEGFVVPCRIVGTAPHLVWVGAPVRPARGTVVGATAGEVVFELCEYGTDDGDSLRR
ncbi:Zn-ribbon domain-containing OB-fold protein [Streptomyces sp. NPDC057694]|uniref:Zn-ribbon domain-containing OB-fold protein n=1 Tax=unclassified Streptomyces TaxID=2593676 RepID=UPI0036C59DE2